MTTRIAGALLVTGLLLGAVPPAHALTAQECSAKYQAAKTAGTLAGQSWSDFRKAQCGAEAAAPANVQLAQAQPAAKDAPAKQPAAKKQAAAPTAPAGPAVYPTAIDPKYAKETASKARIKTCGDQWKANKASNATGGMRWLQKGGGYWSECNKRLKGA